jgi:dipeptidyl aminopeptidase/acylaminoacyl peptidase
MAEATKHAPSIDELIEQPAIGDPQISPDGSCIAYVVRTPDWKKNEYITQIWLVETADKSKPRQLTFAKGSSHSPRWSPDGDWLAFLSKREGDERTQLYRMSRYGGESERLGELEIEPGSPQWSPDGTQIAFTAEAPKSEGDKEREEKFGDYFVDDVDFKNAWLWSLDVSTKKCRKLAGGEKMHIRSFDWSPDGKQIAFDATPSSDFQFFWDKEKIYTVDLQALEVTELSGEGCSSPRWSPDGGQIAYVQIGDPSFYKNNSLQSMKPDGSEPHRILEDFDSTVDLYDWGPDGAIFFAIQRTAIHLFVVDPSSKKARRLTPPDRPEGWVSFEASFDKNFRLAALVASDAEHLAEITLLDAAAGSFRWLTDYTAALASWQTGSPEVFQWMSTDGTPIEGILTRPVNYEPGKKYPLLVVIHGGPSWVSVLSKFGDYDKRNYPIQYWVNKGAFVLQPNYRGSDGYGEAFRGLNVRNLGVGDAWDVISGVDALIDKGWVDPERVGAMGWSQGGYISAFLTTSSDRFKAISVGAGISNWVTYYVNTDIHPFTRQYLAATPWEEMEIYQKTSPMTYIQRAKTPTLIQHGENDRRVPIPNAYELYQGLKDTGVEARLVVYKGMPHGLTRPRLHRQAIQENLDWFNRWIWDEAPEAKAAATCYVALASGGAMDGSIFDEPRVQDVIAWARRDGAEVRVFAGKQGLIKVGESTGEVSRMEAKDVSETAQKVAEQLKEQGIQKLKIYTGRLDKDPWQRIALGCLQVAAGVAENVKVEQEVVEEAGWK